MRKHLMRAGLAAAVLCGCSTASVKKNISFESERPMEQTESPHPAFHHVKSFEEDNLVTDAYTDYGEGYEVHIPAVNLDTDATETFNRHLYDSYMEIALYWKENDDPDEQRSLDYEAHWMDSLLSLEMIEHNEVMEQPYRKIWYYDAEQDLYLSSQEVLKQYINADVYEIRDALMRAAVMAQDEDMCFEPLFDTDRTANMLTMRSSTAAQAFSMSPDAWLFYPHTDRILSMYAPVYSEAADMWTDVLCTINLDQKYKKIHVSKEFIDADVSPYTGEVSITYRDNSRNKEKTFDSNHFQTLYQFAYDRPYVIEGCFHTYTDAVIVNIGSGFHAEDDFNPYLFLLTKNHTVEYVNLFQCALYHTYVGSGPVYGFHDVIRMHAGTAEDSYPHETVYAIDSEGKITDLYPHLDEGAPAPLLKKEWHMEEAEKSYDLSFDEQGLCHAQYSDGSTSKAYEGYPVRLGMNEKGTIYAIDFMKEDGAFFSSILAINWMESLIILEELPGSESIYVLEPDQPFTLYAKQ